MKTLSKKNIFAGIFAMLAASLCFVSCKADPETEYVDKIVKVDKTYASSVTFDVAGTAEEGTLSVTMASATSGAKIYYTTDGSTPTAESTEYTEAILISEDTTFKALAIKAGIENSPISTAKVSIKEKTVETSGEPLKIELSVPSELSNTTTTVTAKITSTSRIKRVVYKKDGSINAAALLKDTNAKAATENESDNTTWTFTVDEKATYTVAAIDETGREETAQIFVQTIDKIAPKEVTELQSEYSAESSITITWTDPADSTDDYDSPFDHVLISYTIDGGTDVTAYPQTIAKGVCRAEITNINTDSEFYTFTVQTVDKLGNKSTGKNTTCYTTTSTEVTAENVVQRIESMGKSGVIKVTGAVDNTVIRNINAALKNLFNSNPSVLVQLDLSEVTGLTELENASSSNKGYSFYACVNIEEIKLPSTLTKIGNSAFYGYLNGNYSALKKIIIPEGVTSIGSQVFYYCENLEEISLPDSLQTINSGAFWYCHSLTSIVIPKNVSSIPLNSPFYDCESLTSVTVTSENQSFSDVDGVLFNKDKTTLLYYPANKPGESYTVPSTVTFIGGKCFSSPKNLKTVTIPASVNRLYNSIFFWAFELTDVVFEDTTTNWYYTSSYNFTNGTLKGPMSEDSAENMTYLTSSSSTAWSNYLYSEKYTAE